MRNPDLAWIANPTFSYGTGSSTHPAYDVQLTTYYSLLTTHYSLLTTHYSLVTYYLLLTTY